MLGYAKITSMKLIRYLFNTIQLPNKESHYNHALSGMAYHFRAPNFFTSSLRVESTPTTRIQLPLINPRLLIGVAGVDALITTSAGQFLCTYLIGSFPTSNTIYVRIRHLI
jgi:hypothetical protein